MRITEAVDPPSWDRVLASLPNPHVLQSWAWGEFKARYGWNATRLWFQEEDAVVAAATVLERKLPRLPLSVIYVPKGPALDWTDGERVAQMLTELESLARQRQALFVKIDPDVYYPDDTPAFSPRPGCAQELARTLAARGWRFSKEQIQFRNTVLLDLRLSEDELLAAMKQKTRYNVRLAARRGVTVRAGTAAELLTFYQLYAETARRDHFVIRPPEYYASAWGSFLEKGLARLLIGEVEREVVAGVILFVMGSTAWYMYGASSERHRQLMPNQLLQWEAIRWAKAQGCTLYDLWGAPDRLIESEPMWGVLQFKLGLGGRVARGLGAWDWPTNRLSYRLYHAVMPRYMNWRRRGADAAP
jgi:lipid II:glycine glycyltransferase (peptidoglycan interpeptide bridge formation enzyme)